MSDRSWKADTAALTRLTSLAGTELVRLVQDPDGTPTSRATTINTLFGAGNYYVDKRGAAGDGVYRTNGVATSGDATFTCATASWSSADIGKPIVIAGAAAASATLSTTIASINSATSVELTVAPSTSVGAAEFYYGTDDTSVIQAALTACGKGESVVLGPGKIYMVSGLYLDGGSSPVQAWQRKGLCCADGGMATLVGTTSGDYLVASKRWLTGDANGTFADNPWHLNGIIFEAFGVKNLACVLKMYGFYVTCCLFKNAKIANFRFTRQNQDASTGTTNYLSNSRLLLCDFVTTLPGIVTTYGFHSQGEAASPHLAPTDCTMTSCHAFGNIAGASPNMGTGIYLENNAGWTLSSCRTYFCGEGYSVYRYGKNHAGKANNWDCNSGVAVRVGQIASTSGFASLAGDNLYADVVVDFTADASTEAFVISDCDFHFDPDETTTGIGGDGKARIVHNNNRATKTIISINNRFKGSTPHRRAAGNTLGVIEVYGCKSVDDTTNYQRQFFDSGATGVVDRDFHDSASPAASDVIKRHEFFGRDSGGNATQYVDVEQYIVDPTNGSEDGGWRVNGMVAGTRTELLAADGLKPSFRTGSVPYIISQGGSTRTTPANTSENILQTVTIPAGAIGPNGRVIVETHWVVNNDASVKTGRVRFGGIGGTAFADVALTSTLNGHLLTNIWNQNSASSQRGGVPATNSAPFGVYGSGSATAAVDTTAAVDIVITGQMADSTDTLQLVFHSITVIYGA